MATPGTMVLDNDAYYAAFSAHDTRFDGRFFIGISSTGIYCRPVCRVKMPKRENCSYHTSAAAAEAAGFRPCMKCRPELAPGHAPVDAVKQLARKAAIIMEDDYLCESSLFKLAETLGITDRHLRRVFAMEFGVSPVQYLQTCKLLLAKNLLTDTTLSITDIALTAGFGSIRRFNDLFKKHYRMTPGELRKLGKTTQPSLEEGITLQLGYRPPYDWESLLTFFEERSIQGVEHVSEGIYRRTVTLKENNTTRRGWISVENKKNRNAVSVSISASLLPVLSRVLSRVRRQFDLNCDPTEIHTKLSVMNRLKPGICKPGTRLPGAFDSFETAARAILGQQVTVKAARTLAARMAQTTGSPVKTPYRELTHTFPTSEEIAALTGDVADHLGPLGITSARARAICALAEALEEKKINLHHPADPEAEMKKLLELPGMGPWTVQYLAMRVLNWPDAFPHTDYGVKKALGNIPAKDILALSEQWKPWRSYATLNLWHSLRLPG